MQMLWSEIKSIINIKNNKFHNISHIVQNGVAINNPKEIAKVFSHYFTNIASEVDSEIPRSKKSILDYLGNKCESSFFLSPIDSAKIESIIAEPKKGKASGPCTIPGDFLKMLSHVLAPCLEILIDDSFTSGIFPIKLKVAKVIALHKKR